MAWAALSEAELKHPAGTAFLHSCGNTLVCSCQSRAWWPNCGVHPCGTACREHQQAHAACMLGALLMQAGLSGTHLLPLGKGRCICLAGRQLVSSPGRSRATIGHPAPAGPLPDLLLLPAYSQTCCSCRPRRAVTASGNTSGRCAGHLDDNALDHPSQCSSGCEC